MKRFLLSLIFLGAVVSAHAMSYEEARDRAWFLTDKMAYELNLTSDQFERAYQINLDYLLSVDSPSDLDGYYWAYRDADLRCILYDWQYSLFRSLDYFFRPVRWLHSAWHYPVLDRYRWGYYYFDRPFVYTSYRGGMWYRRGHNDPSPYIGFRPNRGRGMRDRYVSRSGSRGGGMPYANNRYGNNDRNGGRNDNNRVAPGNNDRNQGVSNRNNGSSSVGNRSGRTGSGNVTGSGTNRNSSRTVNFEGGSRSRSISGTSIGGSRSVSNSRTNSSSSRTVGRSSSSSSSRSFNNSRSSSSSSSRSVNRSSSSTRSSVGSGSTVNRSTRSVSSGSRSVSNGSRSVSRSVNRSR